MSELEKNGELELTLNSDTFEGVRRSWDIVMQRLMKSMNDTNSDEAKITVLVDVKLDTEFIPNYVDGKQNGGRDIKKPTFKHKITSSITVKDEASGNNNTEMELVYDEVTKTYVLKPVLGGEQMTMNDYMRQKAEQEQTEQENGQNLLEGHSAALPGPTEDDDYVEGEFREVGDPTDAPENEENEPGDLEYDDPEEEV